jgi:hypothetical protein
MKVFALVCCLSSVAFANTPCQDAHFAANDQSVFNVFPQIVSKQITIGDRLVFAKHLISSVFSKCTDTELGIDIKNREENSCHFLLKSDATTDVCFLSGKFGYYIVHTNILNTGVIVYNRWD